MTKPSERRNAAALSVYLANRAEKSNASPITSFGEALQPMAFFNEHLRCEWHNESFKKTLGILDNQKLINFPIDHFPYLPINKFQDKLLQLQAGLLSCFETEVTVPTIEGTLKHLLLKLSAASEGERAGGIWLSLLDLTQWRTNQDIAELKIAELRQKNNQLEQYITSNLQLENFAHIASHDMKEPLRMIGNFAQLLSRKFANTFDDEGKEYLNYIQSGVENMNTLINDLLKYSELDSAEHQLVTLQLKKEVDIVSAKLARQLIDAEINVSVPEFSFRADRDKFRQLLFELFSNAAKFRHPVRKLSIDIHAEALLDEVRFYVSDNGIGIDASYFNKIFLLFKRLHPRDIYPGTGIGLALCKKIAEQHAGGITVQSDLDAGTTFCFTLRRN